MEKISFNIHVHLPVFLKKVKFFDADFADTFEGNDFMEFVVKRLDYKLRPVLKTIKDIFEMNPHFKSNIILSSTVLKLLNIKSPELLLELIHLKSKGAISLSIDGSDFQNSPLFEAIIKRELEFFREVFGVFPEAYVSSKSPLREDQKEQLRKLGLLTVCQVNKHGEVFSGVVNLRKVSMSCFEKMSNRDQIKSYWAKYQQQNWVHGIVICFTEVDSFIHKPEIFLGMLAKDAFYFVGLSDQINFRTNPRTVNTERQKVVKQSELQKNVYLRLIQLGDQACAAGDIKIFSQYELLFQEELFQLLDTENPQNYGNENPYQSPYGAYINSMNILKLLEEKIL